MDIFASGCMGHNFSSTDPEVKGGPETAESRKNTIH
jgi:hypothetical protein